MEIETKKELNTLSMPMAIVIAGVLIAGAIYFSSVSTKNTEKNNGANEDKVAITGDFPPITKADFTLGDKKAEVAVVVYADFQCPFCGAVAGSNQEVINYLKQKDPTWTPFIPEITKNEKILFVYRDFPFLGTESTKSAEAARCAGDQNKFWEFHDYLYAHQNGENKGNFSDTNLKSFAKKLNLDTVAFDKCLDESKYAKAIEDSKNKGASAGVTGTPKGFILKDGKVVDTIDGAESYTTVKTKIEAASK